MSGASLNKELLAQGSCVVLETCASTHPKKLHVSDLKTLCKASLVLPLQEYLSFLMRFGYLKLDRETQNVAITLDGQRLLKNKQTDKLVGQAGKHFRSLLANIGGVGSDTRKKARGKRTAVVEKNRTTESSSFSSSSSQSISSTPGSPSTPEPPPAVSPATESFDHLESVSTPTAPLPFDSNENEGTIGGRYQTVEMLGKGSVGTVYLARQIKMGREVAVKEMNGLAVLFPKPLLFKVIRRFAREMSRVAALSHPNIAVILDGNALKDQPYMVFEYLPGGSLHHLLAENEFIPPETAMPIFLQCLNALRYAHHRGVQHRNLKPSNILFDDSGNVRIVDWGMIPVMDKEMTEGPRQRLVSTSSVGYIPPEVLADPSLRNEASDLYSLGMILYEMMAGRLPGRRSPMPTDLYPELPPIVDELFDRMTDDQPQERYPTADDVLEAFHSAEGFDSLVDPSSAVLFWDIAPEEGAMEPIEESPPSPEAKAVGIARIKAPAKPKEPPRSVADSPPPVKTVDNYRQQPTTEVQELPLDAPEEDEELLPAQDPDRPDSVEPDASHEPEDEHDEASEEDPPEEEDTRKFLETPTAGSAVAVGEESLEIEVDVQEAVGMAALEQEAEASDEQVSSDGLVWEDGGGGKETSDSNPSLSWQKTGELEATEHESAGLEVTVTSGDDKMELMSPSEPVEED